VVLGAFIESNGQPSARLHARLEKAAELYKKGFFPTIIVSGGVGKRGFDEAAIMKADLLRDGIPPQHILVDSSGNTTYLTAKNTAHLMRERGLQRVFIISQFYHVPRARLAFNRFGVPNVYYAHANYFEWNDIYSLAREVFAITYYAIRHYERGAAAAASVGGAAAPARASAIHRNHRATSALGVIPPPGIQKCQAGIEVFVPGSSWGP
jgi:vancomycin permeability regulator SanA